MKNLTIGIIGSDSVGKTTYWSALGATYNTKEEIHRGFETNYGLINVKFVETSNLENWIDRLDGLIFMCGASKESVDFVVDLNNYMDSQYDNPAVIVVNKWESDDVYMKIPSIFASYDVFYSSARHKKNIFEPLECLLNLIRLKTEIVIL